jgi:hypothetical protein
MRRMKKSAFSKRGLSLCSLIAFLAMMSCDSGSGADGAAPGSSCGMGYTADVGACEYVVGFGCRVCIAPPGPSVTFQCELACRMGGTDCPAGQTCTSLTNSDVSASASFSCPGDPTSYGYCK